MSMHGDTKPPTYRVVEEVMQYDPVTVTHADGTTTVIATEPEATFVAYQGETVITRQRSLAAALAFLKGWQNGKGS